MHVCIFTCHACKCAFICLSEFIHYFINEYTQILNIKIYIISHIHLRYYAIKCHFTVKSEKLISLLLNFLRIIKIQLLHS